VHNLQPTTNDQQPDQPQTNNMTQTHGALLAKCKNVLSRR